MEIITVKIGNKQLTYHPDSNNPNDEAFQKQLKAVEETKPATLQDFFLRLSELQASKPSETEPDIGPDAIKKNSRPRIIHKKEANTKQSKRSRT